MQGAQVWFLVKGLRSHMPLSEAGGGGIQVGLFSDTIVLYSWVNIALW